jgi:hypothetical protein
MLATGRAGNPLGDPARGDHSGLNKIAAKAIEAEDGLRVLAG